jgi:hypothetical protein
VETLVRESTDIMIPLQDSYSGSQLIELMEKQIVDAIFVFNKENESLGIIKLRKLLSLVLDSFQETSGNIKISVLSPPDSDIDKIAKKKIHSLIERHSKTVNSENDSEGTVRFHKIENQSQKGMYKYETDIRISFGKGKDSVFTVTADDWGAEKSLNKAYSKISRLISDKRKISREIYQKRNVQE